MFAVVAPLIRSYTSSIAYFPYIVKGFLRIVINPFRRAASQDVLLSHSHNA